jgi:hypothetical protein
MLRDVSEIERAPRRALAPRDDGRHAGPYDDDYDEDEYTEDEPRTDWSAQLAAMKRHQVTLGCLALIIVTLIWKIAFVGRYYFRQDDFEIMDLARQSSLSWSYLTHGYVGHFFPGVFAVAWVLSRDALYNWAAGEGVVVIMIAAASLACWRVLRTLFGNRLAILIPLTVYLIAPIGWENYSLWNAGIEAIPLQIAIFMSLDAHVLYVRTEKLRWAVAAAAWLLLGLVFDEKAAVIPVVLFAVTAGFLIRQRGLLDAIWSAAVRLWRAWALYLGLLGLYAIAFFSGLSSSAAKPKAPTSWHAVLTFCWDLLHLTLLPGMLGGPWHWYHQAGSTFAYSQPSTTATWAALVVVLGFIAATILVRRRAWRAWAILAIWVVLADMLPVVLGRLSVPGAATIFGMETRYVSDSAAVLAIVIGLACWPLAEPAGATEASPVPRRQREFFTGPWRLVALVMVAVFVVGSVYSVQKFESLTTTTNARSYVANAKLALADAPPGTIIVDSLVPGSVMIPLFEHWADTSVVLGPLSHRGAQITWAANPTGNLGVPKIFGADGRLYPAFISGVTGLPGSRLQGCMNGFKLARRPGHKGQVRVVVTKDRLVLTFASPSPFTTTVLRIGYLASPSAAGTTVAIAYGKDILHLVLRAGLNNAYFTVSGGGTGVIVQAAQPIGLCVKNAVAGNFVAGLGVPIPRLPA